MVNNTDFRRLIKEDWNAYYAIDKVIFQGDEMDKDSYFRRVEQDGSFGLFIGSELVGWLHLARFGDDEAHLGRIGVAPKYQGQGYGNILMDHAIAWCNEQGGINTINLYTQHDNYTAQGLYKKFNFAVTGTAWHHFVPLNSLQPLGKYTCQDINEAEIDVVSEKYEGFPAAQIRKFLKDERYNVLTLKNRDGNIIGACRFTSGFPGCFPFIIDIPEAFDDFITGLKPYSQPEFDYVRITYTDLPEVAKICEQRGYKLHHKLFKLSLRLHK
ncbi:MAG: GNAT family N-acetyltransferase [Candidatus Thorarchaeota archaeon]